MMYGSSMDYSQEWGVREEELAGRLKFLKFGNILQHLQHVQHVQTFC